jgi:hypothetical protein
MNVILFLLVVLALGAFGGRGRARSRRGPSDMSLLDLPAAIRATGTVIPMAVLFVVGFWRLVFTEIVVGVVCGFVNLALLPWLVLPGPVALWVYAVELLWLAYFPLAAVLRGLRNLAVRRAL